MNAIASALLLSATQGSLFHGTTLDEELDFIRGQIKSPFDSETDDHFEAIPGFLEKKSDGMDELCLSLFQSMGDACPSMAIDVSEYNQRLYPVCRALYQFFFRNPGKRMYAFILQYILNNGNRKRLVAEQMKDEFAEYPKAQYGKREFYVLDIRLESVIASIFSDDVEIPEFIEYLRLAGKAPSCSDRILSAIDDGVLSDKGILSEMFRKYRNSQRYRTDLNKLRMKITSRLIMPYLQQNGLMDTRFMPVEEMEPEDEETEDNNDRED